MPDEQDGAKLNCTRLIPSGMTVDIKLDPKETDGYYVFDVKVVDMPGGRNDIQVLVYDEDGYRVFLDAIKNAPAGTSRPPKPRPLASAKLYWGALYFHPSSRGAHFLILDNSYSRLTLKKVELKVNWISSHY
jgi:hypothetical protein